MPNVLTSSVCLALLTAVVTGQQWIAQNGMPRRENAAIAYDDRFGAVLLHSGTPLGSIFGPPAAFDDLWLLAGGTWIALNFPVLPPARFGAAMVHDRARGRTVLFGGTAAPSTTQPGGPVADTWEFDGTTWSQRFPLHAPPAGQVQSLVFDAVRQRVVLLRWDAIGLLETWDYDGSDWIRTVPPAPVPDVYGGVFAWLPTPGRTLLFGYRSNAFPPVAETWSFDGTSWTLLPTTAAPPDQASYEACEDAAGHVTLLAFPNQAPGLAETWRFDGTNWVRLPTAHTPPGPFGQLVFDRLGSRLVYCHSSSAWSFDGIDWQLATPQGPERRNGSALAWDTARDRLVGFGGMLLDSVGVRHSATHREWDGWAWQIVPQAVTPTPRSEARLVYDRRRQRLVLQGGNGPNAVEFLDTWEYDGVQWQQRLTAHAPTEPVQAMAYDPATGLSIAYAASFAGWTPVASTWRYDGTDWASVPVTQQPPARYKPGFVWDENRGVGLLHGGGSSSQQYADTWEFAAMDWRRRNPQLRPLGPSGPLVFDAGRGAVRTMTAYAPPGADALYEFDGNHWRGVSTATLPMLWNYPLVQDPVRHRLLLLGPWEEVWTLAVPRVPQWTRFGDGCAHAGRVPRLDAANGSTPALGTTFGVVAADLPPQPGALWFGLGFATAQWQGVPLPQSLGVLGRSDCRLWLAPIGPGALVLHGGGTATLAVPLPNQPALAGLHLVIQALTLDPTTPNGLGGLSNAGIATMF